MIGDIDMLVEKLISYDVRLKDHNKSKIESFEILLRILGYDLMCDQIDGSMYFIHEENYEKSICLNIYKENFIVYLRHEGCYWKFEIESGYDHFVEVVSNFL